MDHSVLVLRKKGGRIHNRSERKERAEIEETILLYIRCLSSALKEGRGRRKIEKETKEIDKRKETKV